MLLVLGYARRWWHQMKHLGSLDRHRGVTVVSDEGATKGEVLLLGCTCDLMCWDRDTGY